MKGIYVIVAEQSNEACSAEFRGFSLKENAQRFRGFSLKENAQREMDNLLEKVINVYDLTNKQEKETRKSYKANNGEMFIVNIDGDENIQCTYRLEYIPAEDL